MLKETIFLLFYLPFIFVYEIIDRKKNRKNSGIKILLPRIIFYVYLFFLIKVTIFPIPYQETELKSLREIFGDGVENNFVPLKSIWNLLRNNTGLMVKLRQIGGNLCLLAPLAFYLPFTKKSFKRADKVFIFLIGSSCIIEALQFLIGRIINYNYRVVDIDDIILNVCGGMVGYLVWRIVRSR